jgi:hypothetical protein
MTRFLLLVATSAATILVPVFLTAQQPASGSAPATSIVWPPAPLPRTHVPEPTIADITAADLMTRLYIFSDDSMLGREAGQLGNYKGTAYIASEIQKMGLLPAGDNGTYFQTVPLKVRTLAANSTFSVAGTPLTLGTDYLPLGPSSVRAGSVQTVYGGAAGDTTHTLTPPQVAGKLVVLSVLNPQALGQLRRRSAGASYNGAAAVAVVALDMIPPQFRGFFRRPQTFLDDQGAGTPPPQGPSTFLISSAVAGRLFAQPLAQLAVGAPGTPAALDVAFDVVSPPYPARNVVGILPGSDSRLKSEYVAIGAHNDHIGMTERPVDHDSIRIWNHIVRPEGADDGAKQASPAQQAEVDSVLASWRVAHPNGTRLDSISNGADDDGSGSVTVLEIAQKMASLNPRPKRSILFVWHTGEEKGLLGSEWFTDHPTVPRDSIVAQLNMDMVGRGDAWDETGRTKEGTPLHGSPNNLQLVGSRRLSTELGNIIEQVNSSDHHNLQFDYSLDANGHPANIYCRSDHYMYARYGIPITFFTTGLHSDYHQVTDEPEYIDYPHMARVGSFVEDVAVHVANLDHRPVVDQPKPDPHGACRQ